MSESYEDLDELATLLLEWDFGRPEFPAGNYNLLPYGVPGTCRPLLVVIIDGSRPASSLYEQALRHLKTSCRDVTRTCMIVVCVPVNDWLSEWEAVEPQFSALEARGLALSLRFASDAAQEYSSAFRSEISDA